MSQPRISLEPLPGRDDIWRYVLEVAPHGKQTLRRAFAVHGEKFMAMAGQTELEMIATTLDQAAKQLMILAKVCRQSPPRRLETMKREGFISFREQVARAAERSALKQFQSQRPGMKTSAYGVRKRKTQRWKRTYLGKRGVKA